MPVIINRLSYIKEQYKNALVKTRKILQKNLMASSNKNLSAVLYSANNIKLEHRDLPELGKYDALLEISCAGICGTDIHLWKDGGNARHMVKEPMVLGHESSGIVVNVGNKVKHLKKGDRVAIEPAVPCRNCSFCKVGRYNICPYITCGGFPSRSGSLCRFYIHPADYCYELPDNVSSEEGALLEPLSVCVRACKRGKVTVGSTVLILGCGSIGLMALQVAKAMGAVKIIIVDMVENRLNLARKLGADYTILVKPEDNDECVIKLIRGFLNCLPDTTIDCAGAETTIRLGLKSVKPSGILVIVGLEALEVKIPLISALSREIDVRGVMRYSNDYKSALSLIASGKVNLKPLITHNYKIEDVLTAFNVAHAKTGNAIKVMIHSNLESSQYRNYCNGY